ncbi:MAG: hypothetical protein HQK53_17695, partial [Oligoflexia bacterium]|nr:hypothetical protein [Oligoflexia bacterium]
CICTGDILFYQSEVHRWNLDHPAVLTLEAACTLYMLGFCYYIFINTKTMLNDKISYYLISIVFAVLAFISFKYILIPLYFTNEAGTYIKATTTIYSVIQSFMGALIVPLIIRYKKNYTHLFLQSMLLQIIGDIGIRYVMTVDEYSYSSQFEQSWQISMAAHFIILLLTLSGPFDSIDGFNSSNDQSNEQKIISYWSLRSIVTGILTIGMSAFVAYTLYIFNNAADLTIILFGFFIMFFAANLFAQFLSNRILNIQQIIPNDMLAELLNSSKKDNIDEIRNSISKFNIDQEKNIYEINNLVISHNILLKQISDLYEIVIGQSRAIISTKIS